MQFELLRVFRGELREKYMLGATKQDSGRRFQLPTTLLYRPLLFIHVETKKGAKY